VLLYLCPAYSFSRSRVPTQLETDATAAGKAAQSVAAKLSANTADKPLLRLKILANLFNVLSVGAGLKGNSRAVFLNVFLSVVKYASAVGQVGYMQYLGS